MLYGALLLSIFVFVFCIFWLLNSEINSHLLRTDNTGLLETLPTHYKKVCYIVPSSECFLEGWVCVLKEARIRCSC